MRYVLLVLGLLILAIPIGAVSWYLWAGDFRPAVLPSTINVADEIEKQKLNSPLNSVIQGPFSLPQGYSVDIVAKNLGDPSDLTFSQGGTLLVSLPRQGKIVAIPNPTSSTTQPTTVISNLYYPYGITFHNGQLYVAERDYVSRYGWDEKTTNAIFGGSLFPLPNGRDHIARGIIFNKSGRLLASVGSNCDVCVENDDKLASILETDSGGNFPSAWVKGLRNSVFMAVNPLSGAVWATENGRNFLGDNLPPDEINIIEGGKDYGWPYCYGQQVHDTQFDPKGPIDRCDSTTGPIYEIDAHAAPLGLTFINSRQFPDDWQGDLLVALHGSWNRTTPVGYKIVHLKVLGNTIASSEDFMDGFLQDWQAIGRPVDVEFDQAGNLYISDDKAGVIYRIFRK